MELKTIIASILLWYYNVCRGYLNLGTLLKFGGFKGQKELLLPAKDRSVILGFRDTT